MYAPATAAANAMAPPQKPETFMLSDAAQQSLPHVAQVALQQVDDLKYFLISAPVDWSPDQYIRRFLLPTGEYVSCILWNNLFHISGTDIVRCLSFRFQAFGRPVKNSKKFEEGIFSDLRNLKAGTDASLEEPKSPFLDFMYKNNCIRTQKKQKVFYWYSVPHDRLFLDALERDLKREKMNQEATTVAVSEPALSFEFDSSQSLFEQLTKAQQANTSSFSGNAAGNTFSQSTSPVLRASDSMPPPSLPAQLATVSEDMPAPMNSYPTQAHLAAQQQQAANAAAAGGNMIKREADYNQLQQYDRNGIPLGRVHQRHTSMPTYMEYSPAPSFVSSQGDYGYGQRDLSFEPVTPPQGGNGAISSADAAYMSQEDPSLYSGMPGADSAQGYNMMQMQASGMAGQYAAAGGAQRYAANGSGGNVYSVIEGSPTYKQRRRRSSIPPQVAAAIQQGAMGGQQSHAPPRQSDLRRSVSVSMDDEGIEPARNGSPSLPNGYANMVAQHHDMLEQISRHGTPMQSGIGMESSPAPPNVVQSQEYSQNFPESGALTDQSPSDASPSSSRGGGLSVASAAGANGIGADNRPGPVRRARSATMMEIGPYPHKNHSCPIPTCGRLFKRLEHLKRHVRTHTQERPYVCPHCNKAFSRSDNLAQHRRTHEARTDADAPASATSAATSTSALANSAFPDSSPAHEGEANEVIDVDEADDADFGTLEEEDDDGEVSTAPTSAMSISAPAGKQLPSQQIRGGQFSMASGGAGVTVGGGGAVGSMGPPAPMMQGI